ncbi:avidin-like [Pipra filicauda]|uniref:Avidin n=1 Tax=Pipra filicauda TaxID=649802 RepID=A0A6J2H956_9PASS|nr:avidin-like [Pipra filicauda]
MVQATVFLLVLSLALGAHSLSVEKCNLIGNWTNDLGSNMTILAVDEKGNFAGLYNTSVADHPNKIQQSPLVGFLHLTNPIDQPTFGFTVNWTFSEATSVFTGQCFVDKDGKETLKTIWLFRRHMNTTEDNWAGTLVGTNVFTRLKKQKE